MSGTDNAEKGEEKNEAKIGGFDLKKLRLTQDFTSIVPVKKEIVTVAVRKPDKHEWVRVHDTARFDTAVLDAKVERETFLVDQSLWGELHSELTPKVLFLTVSRSGTPFVWPIRLPGPDGRLDPWNESAMRAALLARTKWVRVSSNMAAGSYDVHTTSHEIGMPEWPELSFEKVIEIAFKDRIISDRGHAYLRRLRGEL